jgi:23S rRNA pseudouridine955/2504/2580 synthase
MRQYKVTSSHHGQRVDTFLFNELPGIPASVLYKAFRKRSIKVDGQRVKESFCLASGQTVDIFIPEAYLPPVEKDTESIVPIVYEDDYLLVVSKPQGIPVHQDRNQEEQILDRMVQALVRQRDGNLYRDGFPALCHRLDRNTGGLVVLAKEPDTLEILLDKFKKHELTKIYHCIVVGVPKAPDRELVGYLKKDSKESRVLVSATPFKGAERIVTRYRVLKALGDFSLLEVELVTGKTHQIRAHLAFEGHPLVGDGKYGINAVNKALKVKWQALWAVRLSFRFTSDAGHLNYLNNVTIEHPQIPWEESLKQLFS